MSLRSSALQVTLSGLVGGGELPLSALKGCLSPSERITVSSENRGTIQTEVIVFNQTQYGIGKKGRYVREKIKARGELRDILEGLKREGKKIVFTNGCFDILHVGHVRCLEEAKRLGNILVVAVNSDQSVRSIKGPSRPLVPEAERAEVVSALACVDYVVIFDEPDPLDLISFLKPKILVKGGDWTPETTIGREVVEGAGGKVVIIPHVEAISTSGIVDRILEREERNR